MRRRVELTRRRVDASRRQYGPDHVNYLLSWLKLDDKKSIEGPLDGSLPRLIDYSIYLTLLSL